jgi:hypothetical protein
MARRIGALPDVTGTVPKALPPAAATPALTVAAEVQPAPAGDTAEARLSRIRVLVAGRRGPGWCRRPVGDHHRSERGAGARVRRPGVGGGPGGLARAGLMLALTGGTRIYLCRAPTDLWKSFDGLSGLVLTQFGDVPRQRLRRESSDFARQATP